VHRTLHTAGRILVAALALTAWIGCGQERPYVEPAEEQLSAAAPARTVGVVQLLYSEGHKARGTGNRLLANAFFVRSGEPDRAALARLLGLPGVPDAAEFDEAQCIVSTDPVSGADGRKAGSSLVELLDAGELTLQVGAQAVPMASQYFPDIVSNVTGVTYEAAVRSPSAMPCLDDCEGRADNALVSATGSIDIGPLEVSLPVPSRVRVLEVGGRAVRHGTVMTELDKDLSVTWEPVGGASDLLLVEVARYGYERVATVRCLAPDTGAFTLPGEQLSKLPPLGRDATDRLQVRRITMRPFDAPGLDEGLAVFVNQDSVLLR
jgi:hypothetical protein